jgi:hypothetical protein
MLYVTDLHGWTRGHERIAPIAQEEGITTIVNGGGIFPHGRDLVAIRRQFIEGSLSPYLERLVAARISFKVREGNGR